MIDSASKVSVSQAGLTTHSGRSIQFFKQILPFCVFGLALLAWELTVRIYNIPHYILPAPTLVLKTLWDNLGSLMVSWVYTMKITFGALLLAVIGGRL